MELSLISIDDCIQHLSAVLREKLPPNEQLPCDETNFLMRFAHVKKCHPKQAAKMLCNYLELRARIRRKYNYVIIPSVLKPILDNGNQMVLKQRDPWGRQVFVFRVSLWDPNVISLDEIMRATFILLEEMVDSVETQENGVVMLGDMRGLTWSHFFQATPTRIMTIRSVLQGNFPLKFKGFHSIYESPLLYKIHSCIKHLFSDKIIKRIHFHGDNLHSLHQFLPQQILPEELGGQGSWEEAADTELMKIMYAKETYYSKWHSLKLK